MRHSMLPPLSLIPVAFVMSLAASGCPGQDTPASLPSPALERRELSFRMVDWDFGGKTIHGLAIEGSVFHYDAKKPAREVQILLMRAGRLDAPKEMVGSELAFRVFEEQAGAGVHQLLDLERGAARVRLLPLDDNQEHALAERVRQFAQAELAREGDAREGERPQQPGAKGDDAPLVAPLGPPPDLTGFMQAIQKYVVGPEGQQRIEMSDEQAVMIYYRYWPMIITHSVVAAAEGTTVVMVTLPANAPGIISHNAMIRLIETKHPGKVEASWSGGNAVVLNVGEDARIDIESVNGPKEGPELDAPDPLVDHCAAILEAGFLQVFPPPGP